MTTEDLTTRVAQLEEEQAAMRTCMRQALGVRPASGMHKPRDMALLLLLQSLWDTLFREGDTP